MENNLYKYGLIGVLLAAIIGVLYYLRKNEKEQGGGASTVEAMIRDLPTPPDQGQPEAETPVLYSTETGSGRAAIDSRMEQIHESTKGKELIADTAQNPYAGLNWKTDFKNAMASIFGSAFDFPVRPGDPRYKQFLENLKNQEKGINQLDREGDFRRALDIWQNAMDFGEFSFWPPDLAEQIELGAFKASGPADKNRSERYHVFAEDAQQFAGNLLTIHRQYENALEKEAIRQLREAGWKFQGIDKV